MVGKLYMYTGGGGGGSSAQLGKLKREYALFKIAAMFVVAL